MGTSTVAGLAFTVPHESGMRRSASLPPRRRRPWVRQPCAVTAPIASASTGRERARDTAESQHGCRKLMSIRFRRSVRLLPGVRLNFSKSGVTTTLGPRGAHVTIGGGRTRVTAGIPGTGLSATTLLSGNSKRESPPNATNAFVGFAVLVVFAVVVGTCAHKATSPPGDKSIAVAASPTPAMTPPPPTATREVSSPRYVTAPSLNVRSAPNGTIVGSISQGSTVQVFELQDGWARIAPTSEPLKWISAKSLCEVAGCAKPPPAPITPHVTASQSKSVAVTPRKSVHAVGGFGCPCSGGHYCVGPRGGVYCYTSGGNKRYVGH